MTRKNASAIIVCDEQDIEIARLRAEVERLQGDLAGYQESTVRDGQMERERDEALAALNDAKKALKIMNQNLDDLTLSGYPDQYIW